MVTALELAQQHQQRVVGVTDRAITKALTAWRRMDAANLDMSWAMTVGPAVVALTNAAQQSNAQQSNGYVNAAATLDGIDEDNPVQPGAFVGVDGSGRSSDGLLFGAVTTTKETIGLGVRPADALLTGATYLAAMMKTAIHDLSRSSDLTGATGKTYTAYIRVVQAGACSRCAMLAGIRTSAHPFPRHPACRCSSYPVTKNESPKGMFTSADDYFDSLSSEQQDKVFTKAGAESIRSGASIQSVVSARRSATGIQYGHSIGRETRANAGRTMQRSIIGKRADGTPILGYTTSEGVTKRGAYGQLNRALGSGNRTRLMPETIVGLTNDPELRVTLLRDAGYIDVPQGTDRTLGIARGDRQVADQFYQKLGVRIG